MVSDFIEEHGGYLRLSGEEYDSAKDSHPGLWKEARQLLKLGAEYEGYWDSEKFLNQVEHSITIAEIKYPKELHSLVFLFDQSSGHTAFSDDALNVIRMNVDQVELKLYYVTQFGIAGHKGWFSVMALLKE